MDLKIYAKINTKEKEMYIYQIINKNNNKTIKIIFKEKKLREFLKNYHWDSYSYQKTIIKIYVSKKPNE